MDCSQFKSGIGDFREGILAEEQRIMCERHLASCIACARLLSDFNELDAVIEQEKAAEPNPFAATRILQRLETEFERPKKTYSPGWIRMLQPVAITAALVCGILIGSYTAQKEHTPANLLVNSSENIEFLRSNLFISEFADEDKILGFNK
jgi:anti-sigma factor RsiW